MDRGRVLHSDSINIVENPRLFLHTFLGLTFADDVYLGYNPTIVKHPDGPKTITVGNKVYTILSTVWRQSMILGRATTCWLVMHQGRKYLIKASWVPEVQTPNELYFLCEAAGIEGVPKLVDWEDVVVLRRQDTTDNNRGV